MISERVSSIKGYATILLLLALKAVLSLFHAIHFSFDELFYFGIGVASDSAWFMSNLGSALLVMHCHVILLENA